MAATESTRTDQWRQTLPELEDHAEHPGPDLSDYNRHGPLLDMTEAADSDPDADGYRRAASSGMPLADFEGPDGLLDSERHEYRWTTFGTCWCVTCDSPYCELA